MYDALRWTLLVLLFVGLFGVWLWAQRRSGRLSLRAPAHADSLKIVQRRWIDQRTGVCLVQADGQSFLLAYTVSGGVSWQPLSSVPSLPASNPTFAPKA